VPWQEVGSSYCNDIRICSERVVCLVDTCRYLECDEILPVNIRKVESNFGLVGLSDSRVIVRAESVKDIVDNIFGVDISAALTDLAYRLPTESDVLEIVGKACHYVLHRHRIVEACIEVFHFGRFARGVFDIGNGLDDIIGAME